MPGRCTEETGAFRPRRRRGTRLILRPALLLLLAEGDSHGYQLMDHLDQMDIDPECLDSSVRSTFSASRSFGRRTSTSIEYDRIRTRSKASE